VQGSAREENENVGRSPSSEKVHYGGWIWELSERAVGIVCTSPKIKAWRFPGGVSVVVAILLLCLGFSLTLLSLPARGSQDPSAFGMANVQSVDQVANWNAPPQEGSYYPFALAEEADDDPVNSGLLTMLLLAGTFLGASTGWLHTRAQGQGALCLCSLGVVGEVLGSVREEYLPILGVFRL
jgi:hypothetical protein